MCLFVVRHGTKLWNVACQPLAHCPALVIARAACRWPRFIAEGRAFAKMESHGIGLNDGLLAHLLRHSGWKVRQLAHCFEKSRCPAFIQLYNSHKLRFCNLTSMHCTTCMALLYRVPFALCPRFIVCRTGASCLTAPALSCVRCEAVCGTTRCSCISSTREDAVWSRRKQRSTCGSHRAWRCCRSTCLMTKHVSKARGASTYADERVCGTVGCAAAPTLCCHMRY